MIAQRILWAVPCIRSIVFACILIASLAVRPASANEVIVGINAVTNHPMSEEQQDEFIEQLRKNGVKTIRQGLDDNHTHTDQMRPKKILTQSSGAAV
jgi:ABC-type uncharacterized transport system substrate-binding protein